MGKSIKHQLIHAINSNFKAGQDKHSMKRVGYERQSTIFSFSDRKNLIDTAAGFANWLKEQPAPPRFLYQLRPEHVQQYLSAHTGTWTGPTMTTRVSYLRKLETLAKATYPNSRIDFTCGYSRNSLGSLADGTGIGGGLSATFGLCRLQQERSQICPFLAGSCGLRVSECAKLKGSDISMQADGTATVRVIDSKGKRSRTITLNNRDTVSRLAEICRESGTGRVCPVQSDSLNAYLRRAFHALGMTEYIDHKTSYHALRKLAAQRYYDACRQRDISIKESLSQTSVWLGHGRNRDELMRHYVLEIY